MKFAFWNVWRVPHSMSGSADIITLPPDLVPKVDASTAARTEAVPSLRTVFIVINTKKPPFSDIRARKALNYGVNVQSIITTQIPRSVARIRCTQARRRQRKGLPRQQANRR